MDEKFSEIKIDYNQSDNKLIKWFRNYWYYYKWMVIGIAFAVFVVLFCTLQTCSKGSPDITILYAGTFPPADIGVVDMEKAIEVALPEDFNGDGEKDVDLAMLMIYSEEQIKEIEKNLDEDEDRIINRSQNAGELEKFQNLVVSGEYYVCLLEQWLFDMVNKEGGFMTLEDAIGYKPDFAVNDYAVRLSDTELGKYYEALGLLEPDTYLCIRTPGAIQEMTGKGKNSDKFKEAAATVKAIIEFKAPEDNA